MAHHGTAAQTCRCVAEPLAMILEELREVVGTLDADRYARPMGELFFGATIGGHVRHCLDHARSLVDGRLTGTVDYDSRERGTSIESDPAAAEMELDRLIMATRGLFDVDAGETVAVAVMPTRQGQTVGLASSVGRELAFILSHTIHHNASIRGMVVSLGITPPKSFGYAPATLAHQDAKACAR